MHPIAEILCIIVGLIIAIIALVDAWFYCKIENNNYSSRRYSIDSIEKLDAKLNKNKGKKHANK